MNLWVVFLTGLTTGGLSCLAVQGGLLASIVANQKENEFESVGKESQAKVQNSNQLAAASFDQLDWLPVTIFLIFKLISHVLLGALLGLLGSVITLSLGARLVFQFLTVLFMFATAMNLLNVHPIFRYVVFQPPKFIQRWLKNTTKSKALFTPAILGLMTIFVPCGVTQAMEVLAISSGSPILGALIMFAFVLGTSPLFAILGIATAKLSELWNQRFLQLAAFALIFMAAYTFNGILTVLDFPITASKLIQSVKSIGEPPAWYGNPTATNPDVTQENGKQKVTINVTSKGYTPRKFTVKAGIPVELELKTTNAYSCATAFTFKKFNIYEQLEPTGSKIVTFTPTEKGSFTYSCSMGMYNGVMQVI